MWKRKIQRSGELIYASLTKLKWLVSDFRIDTAAFAQGTRMEGSAGIELAVPPFAKASVRGAVDGVRADWAADARALHQVLELVVKKLGKLPSLERGDLIREGEWFRWHRGLKLGVGHADGDPALNALIAVDRERIGPGSSSAGLLLNGSAGFVLDPYASDAIRNAVGNRSGSGTERLLNWLIELAERSEADPEASWNTILSQVQSAPRSARTALDMYGLFARDGWLAPYLAEPLMHQAPCEGIAKASFLAVGDEEAVMFASPLFIRSSPLPD